MRLAAVIPHFETLDETRRCLASLRRSQRPVDSLIVVDNGSRDGSARALEAEAIVLVRAGSNLGFSGGCNLGIVRALEDGAERLLILNSDAEVDTDTIERLEAALVGDVAIVGPAVLDMTPAARVESLGIYFSRRWGRMRNLRSGAREPHLVDAVVGCCMLVEREVFERAGLFDERFFYGFEDLELCLRAARHGFATAVVPSATVRHQLARTIGLRSPDRLYYAARNHLLASSMLPLPAVQSVARDGAIVAMNLAHALLTSPAPLVPGVRAVLSGIADHVRGRYGPR